MRKLLAWAAIALALLGAAPALATITSPTVTVTDTATGSSNVFNYGFLIPFQADGVTPAVTVQEFNPTTTTFTTLTPSQYTIVGVGNATGGNVTINGATLVSGIQVIITRAYAYTQNTSVPNIGFYPHTVEQVADALEYQIQQLTLQNSVTSFNNRTGQVVLNGADVNLALGYTPLNPANNLSELTNPTTARANLGLGTFATQNFATPPAIGGTTPNTGAFTTLSSSGPVTFSGVGSSTQCLQVNSAGLVSGAGGACNSPGNVLQHAANNAALQSLASTAAPVVVRDSFAALGDAPPMSYLSSASACTLNAGNGDNGSQVKSADGKCWVGIFPNGPLNVREWGAKGNGSTDDTAAVQAAINFASSFTTPGTVYLPHGQYIQSAQWNISSGISVTGDGVNSTVIFPTPTISSFNVTTNGNGVTLSEFDINYSTAQNSGLTAISLGGAQNSSSTVRDVNLANVWQGINLSNASFFLIDHVDVSNIGSVGIEVSNAQNIDAGDGMITHSTFFQFANQGTGTGIQQQSAGGLRIEDNKFGAMATGVDFLMAGNVGSSSSATSQLLITGNSFDSTNGNGILLHRQSGATEGFSGVIIANNTFPNNLDAVNIPVDPVGVWLTNVTITGNSIPVGPIFGNNPGPGIAINSTNNFTISGNTIWNNFGPNAIGVSIGATATGGLVTGNNLTVTGAVAWLAAVQNFGTNMVITNNPGENPVGPVVYGTFTASPKTFTSGAEPQTIYLSSTSGITNVVMSGAGIVPAVPANTPVSVNLAPNQTVTINFTGTLTINGDIH